MTPTPSPAQLRLAGALYLAISRLHARAARRAAADGAAGPCPRLCHRAAVLRHRLPRWLGPLLLAAGVGYVVNSAALLLWPALASVLFPYVLAPAFVAELSLALWLLTRRRSTGRQDTA